MKKVALLLKFPDLRRSDHLLKFLLLLIVLCTASTASFAQVNVKGKVTDENDAGMPGVNIIIKSTTVGTTSDANGDYVLSAPSAESVLVFSFIGYNTQEVAVGTQTTIDIHLLPNVNAL